MTRDAYEACPFCGNDKLVSDWSDLNVRYQRCVQCGCTGPAKANDAEAMEAWSRRVLDEDWLADVLNDSLDAGWTGRDGARAIIAALAAHPSTQEDGR